MSACVFVIIRPAAVVERTKPKHIFFALAPAALQNVMDFGRGLGPHLPADDAAQIPHRPVECLFVIRHAKSHGRNDAGCFPDNRAF